MYKIWYLYMFFNATQCVICEYKLCYNCICSDTQARWAGCFILYIYIYICLTSKAPCTDHFDWLNIIALQSNMGVALISQSSWGERSSN